jgi:hypothetical protein
MTFADLSAGARPAAAAADVTKRVNGVLRRHFGFD